MFNLETVLDAARNSVKDRRASWAIEELQFASEYAESGYSTPEAGIAFGDWNKISDYVDGDFVTRDRTMPRLASILEHMGFELEWSDEWTTCDECHRAVRTTADSYGWTASYWMPVDSGETYCEECVLEDPSDYLEELSGDASRAVTLDVDLSKHGYIQANGRFENGLYGGQCDDPHIIAESLQDAGIYDFIFKIDSVGQFDLSFTVWISAEDAEPHLIRSKGDDPAEAMKSALKDASRKMSELPDGQGVKYAQCKDDGTADVRLVSPEEFITGIK